MKKIGTLTSALVFAFLATSCSCSKDKYEFYSFKYNGESYKCSKSDKKDETIKNMCNSFDSFSIVLKDKDKAIINMPGIGIDDEETNYKIENDSLYIKDDDEVEFNRLGLYKNGEIKIVVSGVEITLKK